jgi:D-lactate dehydrogenase
MKLTRPLVTAAELIDRVSLRSVQEQPGMPDYLKSLDEAAAALLVEIQTEDRAALERHLQEVAALLADIPALYPVSFTDKKSEYEKLWKIRVGLFPAVGGIRQIGTSVIIEDVAFPKDKLADAVQALRMIMNKHAYQDGIIYGHALDGNVHFVFTQDFNSVTEIERYQVFINDVCDMVVNQFHGSLKAEHGTGRNMAPFVEMEWGKKAYSLMKKLKAAFDPENLLNPDVILTNNAYLYVENLKPMPPVDAVIDKCIECGYCEVLCPSKNLTSTPRQRIVVGREIARLQASGHDDERLSRLLADYVYFGDETCATDGLCEVNCPIAINTGSYTKFLRSTQISTKSKKIAKFIGDHFAGVTTFAKVGLAGAHLAHRTLGTCTMSSLARTARSLSGNRIPKWNKWLPTAGATPHSSVSQRAGKRKIVYFPSCLTRTMGPAKEDRDQRQLNEVMLSLLEKAGYQVVFPQNMNDLCCGMPFESKGFFEEADKMGSELEKVLLGSSSNGEYPVLCDTSPCVYRMKRVMDKRLIILDTVEFIYDYLLESLQFTKIPETIAVHVTCSAIKMGLKEKFQAIAEACATRVIMPEKVKCCGFAGDKGFEVPELNESALEHLKESLPADCSCGFSNSRTCEIGLADQSGISYQSIAYLVDRCTSSK